MLRIAIEAEHFTSLVGITTNCPRKARCATALGEVKPYRRCVRPCRRHKRETGGGAEQAGAVGRAWPECKPYPRMRAAAASSLCQLRTLVVLGIALSAGALVIALATLIVWLRQ